MNEFKKMVQRVHLITLAATLIVSILTLMIFRREAVDVLIGLWLGAFAGMMGFMMIVSMAKSLEPERAKFKGMAGYYVRYAFYAVILFFAGVSDIPILAVLVGILCHKFAVFIFAYKKER